MATRTLYSIVTPARRRCIEIETESSVKRAKAVAKYRPTRYLAPQQPQPSVLVWDMLYGAVQGSWARKTAEGPWLSLHELNRGTGLSDEAILEALLKIAFEFPETLCRRLVDRVIRYSIAEDPEEQSTDLGLNGTPSVERSASETVTEGKVQEVATAAPRKRRPSVGRKPGRGKNKK